MPDKRSEKRPEKRPEKRSTNDRHSSTARTSKSTTNPVPLKSALANNSSSKPPLREKKSKTASLFSLFSRPHAERAKVYSELPPSAPISAALPPPDIGRERPSTRQSVRSTRSGIASRLSFTSRADSPPPPHTLKRPASRISLALGAKSSSEPSSKSRKRDDAPWEPPPLFQAYPQALRHTSLRTQNTNQDSGPFRSESRMSRPGSVLGRSKSRQGNRDGTASRAALQEGWSKKTYILVTSGYLLEYHGEGAYDRLPEKVLKLGMDSAAFASDLLPGYPYVLQILQTAGNGVQVVQLPQKSLLSRLGLKSASSRRNVTNLLMIFEDAEVMDTWMIAIRKEIEALGGKRSRPESTMLGYGSSAIIPQSTVSRYEAMQRSEMQRSDSRQSNNTVRPFQPQSAVNRYDSMQSNSSRRSNDTSRLSENQNVSRYDSMRSNSSRQSNHTTTSVEPPTISGRYDPMQRSSSRQSNHTMRFVRNMPSLSTLHEVAPSPTISKFRNIPEVPPIMHDYQSRAPTQQSYIDDDSDTDDTESEQSVTDSRPTSRAESHAMSEDWFDGLPGEAKTLPPPTFANGTPRRSSDARSPTAAPFMGLSQRHAKHSTSTLGPKPRLSNFSRPHYVVPPQADNQIATQARAETPLAYPIRERSRPDSLDIDTTGPGIQSHSNSTASNHSHLSSSTIASSSTKPSTRTSAMTLPSLKTDSRGSNNNQRISPDPASSDSGSSATPTTERRRTFRGSGGNLAPLITSQYQSQWSAASPISPASRTLPPFTPDASMRRSTPSPVNGLGSGNYLCRPNNIPIKSDPARLSTMSKANGNGVAGSYMPNERASIVVPIVRPPSVRKDRRPSGDMFGRGGGSSADAGTGFRDGSLAGDIDDREREWEEKRMSAVLPPMMPPPTSPLPRRPRKDVVV